jgi:prevent-host-death family protein
MREYVVYEAKAKLADLMKHVQQGERVTITNCGEPVADLVPSAGRAAQRTKEAIAAIKAMRAGSIDQAQFAKMHARGRRWPLQ